MKFVIKYEADDSEEMARAKEAAEFAVGPLLSVIPGDVDIKRDDERGRLVIKTKRLKPLVPAPVDTLDA